MITQELITDTFTEQMDKNAPRAADGGLVPAEEAFRKALYENQTFAEFVADAINAFILRGPAVLGAHLGIGVWIGYQLARKEDMAAAVAKVPALQTNNNTNAEPAQIGMSGRTKC